MARKVLLGCGIASSALYIVGDIVGNLRYPGYRWTDQQFSELLAAGSPVRPLVLALNGIPYAVLVTAFGVGVWQAAGPRRARRIAGALLVGFALMGMVTGVLFRMNTREALAAGERGLRNNMHLPGTAVMSLSLMVGMGFAATLLGRRFRYYTYGTLLGMLVSGGLAALQASHVATNQPTPGMGIEQRVNIYTTMLWIAVLAIGLLRAEAERPEASAGAPTVTRTARPLTPSVRGGAH